MSEEAVTADTAVDAAAEESKETPEVWTCLCPHCQTLELNLSIGY